MQEDNSSKRDFKTGNLVVTIIMLGSLVLFAYALLDFLVGDIRLTRGDRWVRSSVYVAEAGLHKTVDAILKNEVSPPYTATENFGEGSFSVSAIRNGAEITVTSVGTVQGVGKTVVQKLSVVGGDLPQAFRNAIYANGNLELTGSASVQGDFYTNGNAVIETQVTNGSVYHTGTVSGSGTYTDGGVPNPTISMPALDTSYYDQLLQYAQLYGTGSQNFNSEVNLNGGTLYVNGSITLSGSTVVRGSGRIVATGTIDLLGSSSGDTLDVTFVSGSTMSLSGNVNFSRATFYAATQVAGSGNIQLANQSAIISPNSISLAGNSVVTGSGIIYGGSQVALAGHVDITGSVVGGSFANGEVSGSANVIYQSASLPPFINGLSNPMSMAIMAGSFKQL